MLDLLPPCISDARFCGQPPYVGGVPRRLLYAPLATRMEGSFIHSTRRPLGAAFLICTVVIFGRFAPDLSRSWPQHGNLKADIRERHFVFVIPIGPTECSSFCDRKMLRRSRYLI